MATRPGGADGSGEQGVQPEAFWRNQEEAWFPQSRTDGGPSVEDIMTWQQDNKPPELALYHEQVLAVLAEVYRDGLTS